MLAIITSIKKAAYSLPKRKNIRHIVIFERYSMFMM